METFSVTSLFNDEKVGTILSYDLIDALAGAINIYGMYVSVNRSYPTEPIIPGLPINVSTYVSAPESLIRDFMMYKNPFEMFLWNHESEDEEENEE
jgi:hypothetical protein